MDNIKLMKKLFIIIIGFLTAAAAVAQNNVYGKYIKAIDSLDVGNLNLDGNNITNNASNVNLDIKTTGASGYIEFQNSASLDVIQIRSGNNIVPVPNGGLPTLGINGNAFNTTYTENLRVNSITAEDGTNDVTFGGDNLTDIATTDTDSLYVSGNADVVGDIQVGDGLLLNSTSSIAGSITATTSDATDNASIRIGGGGAISSSRGGFIQLAGNESGITGQVNITAGNVVGGSISMTTGGNEVFLAERLGDITITPSLDFVVAGTTDTDSLYVSGNANVVGTLDVGGNATFSGNVTVEGKTSTGDNSELTIASNTITVTGGFHKVDTEGDAATDDLDTVNGGIIGQVLVLRSDDNTRDTTLTDGTGNLRLNGNFTLSNVTDTITLIYTGSVWLEVSRSDNG
jgi:carbonic anhydrase/acetyltransferase-like protein (isoleucine patch superfamily)